MIEFAVCMPVLIILLFYINDLIRIKRYYSQTEFVGQQTANMIQNISKNRENPRITKTDLLNIHALAWQTVYPGVTIFRKDSVYPLNHKPITSMYYVRGLSNGKASCIWRTWTRLYESPSKYGYNSYTNDNPHSAVRYLTETVPANIYPTLKINPNEVKIIVETLIERDNSGVQYSGVSDRVSTGLYLVNPAKIKDGTWSYMFHSVVIFTPKPGLFTETAPQ